MQELGFVTSFQLSLPSRFSPLLLPSRVRRRTDGSAAQALDDPRVTVVADVDLNGGDIAGYLLHELE